MTPVLSGSRSSTERLRDGGITEADIKTETREYAEPETAGLNREDGGI